MTDALPAPLVPADVDLQDFRFMPLDVVRLRDSQLAAVVSGEAFRCAVLLWCVSWHQVPAGSLPDDDVALAGYAGFGRSVKEWRKFRAEALHGWVKCADNRLYHPVVSAKALEARDQKLRHLFRSECNRLKKSAERAKVSPQYPTWEQWHDNFIATGSRTWTQAVPASDNNLSPATMEGRSGEVTRNTALTEQNRTEQNRTDQKSFKSSSPTPSASMEYSEGAQRMARALSKGGYGVEADSDLIRSWEAKGIPPGEVEEAVSAASGFFRRKPLAWVIARVDGRHDERGGQPKPAPTPVLDPVTAARNAAAAALNDALIGVRRLRETGIYDDGQAATAEAKARAVHAAALAAVEGSA